VHEPAREHDVAGEPDRRPDREQHADEVDAAHGADGEGRAGDGCRGAADHEPGHRLAQDDGGDEDDPHRVEEQKHLGQPRADVVQRGEVERDLRGQHDGAEGEHPEHGPATWELDAAAEPEGENEGPHHERR